MPDREAIRSNAKYLRQVRPIDPDEIADYVPDGEHPAVVRQVLREEAFDLGLRETEDGVFVPVEADPLTEVGMAFEGVDALPEEHVRGVQNLLVERFGPDWPTGESGDRLRGTIRRFKDDYYRGRPVEYDDEVALGYAVYHLADYYATTQYLLAELAAEGLLSRRLRVLDVGAGVGGPALALLDLLPEDALVDYHAVEPSDAAADVFESLVEAPERNAQVTVHRERAEPFDPEAVGEVDLLLCSNVLSELDDPAATLARSLDALAPDGTCLAVAPADRNTAIGLREVERAVEGEEVAGGEVGVYAPEVRLWPGATPSDDGWSFDRKPDIEVPPFQRRLDDAATDPEHTGNEFVNADVQYAYSVLRVDGQRRYDVTLSPESAARFSDSETHVTNRVDATAVKLSRDLSEDGHPLFRVGDGSQSVDHYAVVTNVTATNRDVIAADYGDLLVFEGLLVLWNDDEGAYNLVVDEETFVDRVPR